MQLPVVLRRQAYRTAYRVLRVYWFVTRPRKRGVKCVLRDGDRILLVRHTYGSSDWALPGGSLRRREAPIDGARREMLEELGIAIPDWAALGEFRVRTDYRHDTLYCLQSEVDEPRITIDRAEVAAARWFDLGGLPPDLSPNVWPIVALNKTGA